MPPPHYNTNLPPHTTTAARIARAFLLFCAALAVILGLGMTAGGLWLITLGGTWYYTLAGLGFLTSGVLLIRRRDADGLIVLAATLLFTLAWSLWEVHQKGWMQSWGFDLAGRIGMPLGIFLAIMLAATFLRRRHLFTNSRSASPADGAPV